MNSSPATFLIRPVRPDEYAALGELTVAAYHALTDVHFGPEARARQLQYDAELHDVAKRAELSSVLVATGPGGELLGGVTYVRGPDDPYSEELADGEAGMRMLAVDTANQGHGVGRALARACLDRARESGRSRLVLHTGAWMPAAVRLYESMGFIRRPELDFSAGPGIDLIAYSFEFGPLVDR
jgi:ribosomal protein S18 acetylase RimI-like enzyme